MSWLGLAALVRLMWAAINMIDQYLSRYFGEKAFVSAALLDYFMVLPFLAAMILYKGIPDWPPLPVLLWIGLGAACFVLALFPYIRAIQIDEARNAISVFEVGPVIIMILAWALFGEIMTAVQIFAALLIIVCGALFLLDFNRIVFQKKTFALMLLSTVLYSFFQLSTRFAGQRIDQWDAAIIFSSCVLVGGVLVSAVRPDAVKTLVSIVKKGGWHVLGLSLLSQTVFQTSTLCLIFAYSLAPTAGHVAALSGLQPVFVMALAAAMGIIGHRHFPKVRWNRDTAVKILLLIVMCGGIVLLRM